MSSPIVPGMAISTKREETLEECKRHIDECAALLERTSVPEYREAIIAMGKAWIKIAEQAGKSATSHGIRNFAPVACPASRRAELGSRPQKLHEIKHDG